MALAPLSLSKLANREQAESVLLTPSEYPLQLLLDRHPEETRARWNVVFGSSLLLHLLLLLATARLPGFIHAPRVAKRVIEHRIPLYLPPDLLTQRAPNREAVSKHIDLSALMAEQAQQHAQRAKPAPSRRRFELPKQAARHVAKSSPQILPEAPQVAQNQPPAPSPGALSGLPVAPAPAPKPEPGPFQSVGSEVPPNPHPTLAPPKATVQAAVRDLARAAGGNQLILSDEKQGEPQPGLPGLNGEAGAQHAVVELQSDPQGADFKPYLTRILAIVRANWRQVIPDSVRTGALRGTTVLEFIIDRDGNIPKMVIAQSSGTGQLDRAAIAGLSMSNRLPPLPTDFKGYQVRLAFSFAYNAPTP
jgi:TonB family protein